MEIALLLSELHSDLLPTAKEVGKLLQSHRCDFRVVALCTSLEMSKLQYVGLVMFRPNGVQVSVNMEALRIRNSERPTPPSQRLSTAVGVVSMLFGTGSLRNHPVDCHLGDISCVRSAITSRVEPSAVASLATTAFLTLELPDELQSSERTASTPLDWDRWVSILTD